MIRRTLLGVAVIALLPCARAVAQAGSRQEEQREALFDAVFGGTGKPITSGLVWRLYTEAGESTEPVATSKIAQPRFQLEPGNYILHVGYGLAGTVRRITVGPRGLRERVVLNAGALSLAGAIGDTPLKGEDLKFQIFAPLAGNSEGKLIAEKVPGDELIRLPEGVYHIVSSYGDTNAVRRADIRVESGQVTTATINHRAATVTLKLVINPGGEALAGTGFSVLTPGGDVIREAFGAFPSMILAEGEYIAIARQDGKVYTRPFKVDSGLDRDIEVLAR